MSFGGALLVSLKYLLFGAVSSRLYKKVVYSALKKVCKLGKQGYVGVA